MACRKSKAKPIRTLWCCTRWCPAATRRQAAWWRWPHGYPQVGRGTRAWSLPAQTPSFPSNPPPRGCPHSCWCHPYTINQNPSPRGLDERVRRSNEWVVGSEEQVRAWPQRIRARQGRWLTRSNRRRLCECDGEICRRGIRWGRRTLTPWASNPGYERHHRATPRQGGPPTVAVSSVHRGLGFGGRR
jgi:hypothetical protein